MRTGCTFVELLAYFNGSIIAISPNIIKYFNKLKTYRFPT